MMNHLEVMASAHHAVRDGPPITTLVLARPRRILWAEMSVKLSVLSLLRGLHRGRVSRPDHFPSRQALGTLTAIKACESRAYCIVGQAKDTR